MGRLGRGRYEERNSTTVDTGRSWWNKNARQDNSRAILVCNHLQKSNLCEVAMATRGTTRPTGPHGKTINTHKNKEITGSDTRLTRAYEYNNWVPPVAEAPLKAVTLRRALEKFASILGACSKTYHSMWSSSQKQIEKLYMLI